MSTSEAPTKEVSQPRRKEGIVVTEKDGTVGVMKPLRKRMKDGKPVGKMDAPETQDTVDSRSIFGDFADATPKRKVTMRRITSVPETQIAEKPNKTSFNAGNQINTFNSLTRPFFSSPEMGVATGFRPGVEADDDVFTDNFLMMSILKKNSKHFKTTSSTKTSRTSRVSRVSGATGSEAGTKIERRRSKSRKDTGGKNGNKRGKKKRKSKTGKKKHKRRSKHGNIASEFASEIASGFLSEFVSESEQLISSRSSDFRNSDLDLFDESEIDMKWRKAQDVQSAVKLISGARSYAVDASLCRIDSSAMELLCSCLELNSRLRKLDLSQNTIGKPGIIALQETLSMNQSLLYLDLSSCALGDMGADCIADTLKGKRSDVCTCSLTTLHLASNGITEVGAESICEGLLNNSVLRYLNLKNNKLKDDGALAFADLIERASPVCSTAPGKESQAPVIQSEQKHSLALEQLDLSDNDFTESGVKHLLEALEDNKTITELTFGFDKEKHKELVQEMKLLSRCIYGDPEEEVEEVQQQVKKEEEAKVEVKEQIPEQTRKEEEEMIKAEVLLEL